MHSKARYYVLLKTLMSKWAITTYNKLPIIDVIVGILSHCYY